MRISDWSSDVCSSDLDRTLRPPPEGRGLLHRSLGHRCCAFPLPRNGSCAPPRRSGHRRHRSSSRPRREVCQAVAAPPLQLLGKLRSEEHTSELQSLMRLSYAVFCLENKQKINTITEEHKQ